ncbi:hypothetical protein N2T27_004525 [Salmonella enterica]|nr:hypothetical protein [Salmonella enterica]
MKSQLFTHENEILAMAPLGEDDRNLFSKQGVRLIGRNEIQWDFIFPNGKDYHFRQKVSLLRDELSLSAYKNYIRRVLIDASRQTVVIVVDGKKVSVPFRYEVETGGRMIKVPELHGEFIDATELGETVPTFISIRR